MRKMLCASLKAKIIIAFGYMLFGFCAKANQLNTDQLNTGEVKESITDENISSEEQVVSENPWIHVKSDEAKRNGFFTVKLTPRCSFSSSKCIFDLSTNYGIVFGKSSIADAGILEGKLELSSKYMPKSEDFSMNFRGVMEINYLKNDGKNKMIPGFHINTSFGYEREKGVMSRLSGLGLGIHLKAFLSKQIAVISHLTFGYFMVTGDPGKSSLLGVMSNEEVGLGLGLRRYF